MYGDNTSRSKNSLPGTSHGKTSSSHGTGSSNHPGTSHGSSKGAASRKGSPGGGSSEHLYGNSSYGNIMSGVDTSVSSVNSSMLGLQARYLHCSVPVRRHPSDRALTGQEQTAHCEGPQAEAEYGWTYDHDGGDVTCDV
jgi:hypothetical protein